MVTVFDKVYWMRIGLGILFGVAAEYILGANSSEIVYYGLSLGILGYLVSYYLARLVWFRKLDRSNTSKVYTTGIGAYVGMYLFTWVLLFTISLVGV
jgi:hypothetical protein